MLYKFTNTDNKTNINLDLPNCEIKTDDKSYIVKDSQITVFHLDDDGKHVGNGERVSSISLSSKQLSVFTTTAEKDNYNSRLDDNDLSLIERKDFKAGIADIFKNSEDIKVKKVRISDYSFSFKVKNKDTKEEEALSYKETRPGFLERVWQKIKPKDNVKYKTAEFNYIVKKNETVDLLENKFNVPIDKIVKKNSLAEENPEINIGQAIVIPKQKHKIKVLADNVQTIPAYVHTVEQNESLAKIANINGISQYRLIEANPQLLQTNNKGKTTIRALQIGEQINIPEYKVITKLNSSSLRGIAEQIGISEIYIEDILFGIEGRHSKPDLSPYYDGVKDKKHPKGYLTIGFGHTGRVFGTEMNSKNKDSIQITEDEAYLILAQDLMIAKQDAEHYFGEDFNDAPLSIQEAIVDIIFNKGVEGLNREDSPCLALKQNLKDKDYVSAAANVIVDPTVRGLMKRNTYRVMMATRDLKPKKRAKALEKAQNYYERTLDKFKNRKSVADSLKKHWEDAQQGKVFGFFK